MADNVRYFEPATGGTTIATREQTGGEHIQRITLATNVDPTGATTGLVDVARDNPIPVSDIVDGAVQETFTRFLKEQPGDVNFNATGDYSGGGSVIFHIKPPSDEIWRINALAVVISEEVMDFDPGNYGGTVAALANGVVVRIQNDLGTVLDVTDGNPVQTNAQWVARDPHCTVVSYDSVAVGTDRVLWTFRWDFRRLSSPLRIDGTDDNGRLEVFLNDDFSSLFVHYFMAHGYVEGTAV